MSYLIDGHNLIPKKPGMSLRALDDEIELIHRLQVFCREERKNVEVFFDQAAPGQAGIQKHGLVSAHFVRAPQTADQAIENRLQRLGRKATQYTVVSSDHAVQNAARRSHARVISSEDFARQLRVKRRPPKEQDDERDYPSLSAEEVSEWEKLFKNRGEDKNR